MLAQTASTVVHYVGGAEVRYAATASNGAGALKEVRRTAGNVLVVQDVSREVYQLKRLTLLTDFQGSTHRVLSAMTQQPVAPVTSTSFDAWASFATARRGANLGHRPGDVAAIQHDARLHGPRDGRAGGRDPHERAAV
ncbi:hypothetical protein [Dokdonella sp.]|uniref:hypothetical protein n=1 Tax=Dokdonella sp. TaxID=2291710 RepID=UPI001B1EAF72|nr:hypothetical protein [Dokdonella sp.]MBO9661425.1 hypothetical protein [Dokdonella sp.]